MPETKIDENLSFILEAFIISVLYTPEFVHILPKEEVKKDALIEALSKAAYNDVLAHFEVGVNQIVLAGGHIVTTVFNTLKPANDSKTVEFIQRMSSTFFPLYTLEDFLLLIEENGN